MFNKEIWQQEVKDRLNLKDVRAAMRVVGVNSVYAFVAGATLWPVVAAYQQNPTLAIMALGGVFGGMGGNLLAEQLQRWQDKSNADLQHQLEQDLAQDDALRAEVYAVLAELKTVQLAQAHLSDDDKTWFLKTLTEELVRLDEPARFEAVLTGSGIIVQGERNQVAKDNSVAVGHDVHGNVTITINNYNTPPADTSTVDAQHEAYLNRILSQCNIVSLTGIDPKTANDTDSQFKLSAVYTALLTTGSEQMDRMERGQASALSQLNRHPRLVLLGDPGSGKSTFVNFVTMCLAGASLEHPAVNLERLTVPLPDDEGNVQEERQPWHHGMLLPVRVILRDFAARGLPESGAEGTAAHLWNFINAELEQASLSEYAPHLRKTLMGEGGLLLLDGLDEVPEANKRRVQLKEVVTDFARTFSRCRIVVTSRTYAYQNQQWRLPDFTETVLDRFSAGQIRRFVDSWYAHIAELRQTDAATQQGRAEILKRAIFQNERLHELAVRPLLLTLIASLHAWRGGTLPERREELYDEAVKLLLDRWESERIVPDASGEPLLIQPSLNEWLKVDQGRMQGILEELAYEAHASQPELVGTADVDENTLVGELMRANNNPDVNAGRLVEYLRDRAGLLLPRGVGVYTFPHRTFQEYLAARHLTEDEYPDKVAKLAREEPNRWREVALLAGAKAGTGSPFALWEMVEALCYRGLDATDRTNADAWGGLLAGQLLVEAADLTQISERYQPRLERVRAWLVDILTGVELPAVERAAAGNSLARLPGEAHWAGGDPRPGVGLRADGLPDIDWVHIPAGTLIMGGEGDKRYKYTLPYDYEISRYVITNAQYEAFVKDGGYTEKWRQCWTEAGWEWKGDRTEPRKRGGEFDLPNHPVVNVSWYEAVAFCKWLTLKLADGSQIKLPSEAEWEKAARSSDGRVYPWGNEVDSEKANYSATQIGVTSAVGCFPGGASPCGAEDMSGNVWEWCRTKWEDSYENYSDDNNLKGNFSRVLRGGAFFNYEDYVRCAIRNFNDPNDWYDYGGFRVLLVVPR